MIRLVLALLALIAAPAFAQVKSVELAFDNGAGRQVPITIVAKPGKTKGIIIFSHGALSSPAKYSEITTRWAKAGYTVFAPLHADSTDWTGLKAEQKDQLAWRLSDMKLTYAKMPELATKAGVKLGKAPFYAAGHSFGALISALDTDPRVRSVIAFSPPGPLPGLPVPIVSKALLTITGTADAHPMMAPTWQAHLAVHKAATGPAWAYAGEGADHYYGGIFCRPELPGPKSWRAFDDALALTMLFLKEPKSVARFKPKAGMLEAR